ncbi:MAG: hypothetical protein GEU93_11025 [Propionibacteriales bacterium]|nr:hypothetical protein [Propionibacteriales bacterium]
MAAAFTSESATRPVDRPTLRLLVRSAVFSAGLLAAVLLSTNDAQAEQRADRSQGVLSGLVPTADAEPRSGAAGSGPRGVTEQPSGTPDETAGQRPADGVQPGAQSIERTVGVVVKTTDDAVRRVRAEVDEKVAEPTRDTVEETVKSVEDAAGDLPGDVLELPDETLPRSEEPPAETAPAETAPAEAAPAEAAPAEAAPAETGPTHTETARTEAATQSTAGTEDPRSMSHDRPTKRLAHNRAPRSMEHPPDGSPVVTSGNAPSVADNPVPHGNLSVSHDSGASSGQPNTPGGDEPAPSTGCTGVAMQVFAAMTGWEVPGSGLALAMAPHRTACSTGPVVQPGFSPD